MSDIRFEGWLHRSGTGGVYQDSAGNVGIASTQPQQKLDIGNGGFQVGPTGIATIGIATITTLNTTNIVNSTKLSHRNLVINGAMQIAQRATSSTTTGFQTVDRFAVYHSTNDTVTQAQVDVSTSDLPYTQAGLTKALKVTNGNQSSAGAAEYVEISYKPEAQDIKNSGWIHTSSSSKLTLSFWARSSVGQTFTAWFTNRDGTRQNFVFTYALAANTWTKITKTMPGNSNLTINNDNGAALELWMQMFYGTNYSQASPPGNNTGDWVGHENETVLDNTTTWYLTSGATFELTGVQLEVGSVATPFEHRTPAEEYVRCCRYYQEPINYTKGYLPILAGRGTGTSTVATTVPLVCNMRDEPATTGSSMSTIYAYGYNSRPASSSGAASAVSNYGHDPRGGNFFHFTQNGYGGNITDDRIWNIGGYGTGSKLVLDAEL